MVRGAAGTDGEGAVTSGDADVTSGFSPAARRRALIAVVVLFAVVQSAVNGVSRLSDMRGAGSDVPSWMIAVDETTSFCAWLVCMVVIWHLVARVRPPRVSWPLAVLLHVLATAPVSLLHIGLMVLLREGAYASSGIDYDFAAGGLWPEIFYEYRKDAPVYFLIAAAFAGIQWVTRAVPRPEEGKVLTIHDGNRRIHLPHEHIASIEAAGNYVEIRTGEGTHLHRATMQDMQDLLGRSFLRIHRSRLVRRDAIRAVERLASGDFIVTTTEGKDLRGSRRYRDALD